MILGTTSLAVLLGVPLVSTAAQSSGLRSSPIPQAAGPTRSDLSTALPTPPDATASAAAAAIGQGNRLQHETSPYLLLHAHNPVDWYPWGAEAIERARREEKPIFLSVGYSSCYWCHVMERGAFSSPETASFLNEHFINIKVDREERPELDEIYMTATQLLAGRAGWPNSVFLTPALEPFFAGTYFPQDQFRELVLRIHEAWRDRRGQILDFSKQVTERMQRALAAAPDVSTGEPPPLPGRTEVERSVRLLKKRYDAAHGGFGGAPKFPSPGNLLLLWGAAEEGGRKGGGDPEARTMVLTTLRKMVRGGIYDQIGGGFHRYSTDERWLVPHFEKMLYDNAHLAELLARTAAAEGDAELRRAAVGTLEFVRREMTTPEGAFRSALDAETEAEEGAYYVWTHDQVKSAVGAAGFARLAPIFGLDGEPNFEGGRYVLHLRYALEKLAAGGGPDGLVRIAADLDKLLEARGRRPYPLLDDKVLTDWNGMMISAYAVAGALLEVPAYVEADARAADFVLTRSRSPEGRLLHAWRDGRAKIPAFLGDYVFLIDGLLELHSATGAECWLVEARRLAEELEATLAAPSGGYFTSVDDPLVLFQIKSVTDGALPAANAMAIRILDELARRTGAESFARRADAALRAFGHDLVRYPQATQTLALATLERSTALAERPGSDR